MKPCLRKAMPSVVLLQNIATGPIVAKIQGSVKKLGQQYQDATLILYNKANFKPIAVKNLDRNGNYQFLG